MTDTLPANIRHPSKSAIDSKVTYSATGHIKRDIIHKKMTLIESAVVDYGDLEIKADSMVLNMNTNLLFAAGRSDTTGKIIGKPSFKEGSQKFDCDELTYNFKTKKARIKNIITKQDEGLLHSAYTKLLEDGTSNIARSSYSTCDADTPHFYINLPRARVYPGKKIISGPGNLVLEGIPLPLVIPFGYFPVNTKKAASGILFPRIGQENLRGYSLSDGGYYFAISHYIDLTLKGNIYANGSWLWTAQTTYNRLYRYKGNFSFDYANNILGHKGLPDYSQSSNYSLKWMYSQDPKASPGSTFSASVNMSSSGYDKNNSYVVADHVTTTRQSSVSYSKSWIGTPFNLSMSANQVQNTTTQKIDIDLPQVNFNMGRIYPLKSRNSTGPSKWYQELQLSYTAKLDNKISTKDSAMFTSAMFKNMNNGFTHNIPLSLQIRPFKNFSISPALTYTGVMYTAKYNKRWDPNHFDAASDRIIPSVVTDTIHGVFYGQAVNPSISASYSPQIFGMFTFTDPNSRLQAIRHVIKPSIGFSFIPKFAGLSSKMYRQSQVDSTGRLGSPYSIYEGNMYGTPSTASKNGNISFSLVNLVEGKIFARNDTTGKPKKIKIIDNFSINTSYNIFADSMRWAPVTMQLRTTIFEKINISTTGGFSLYGLNKSGTSIGTFLYDQTGKLMRLTNFGTSLDFSLSELLKGNKNKNKSGSTKQGAGENDRMSEQSGLNGPTGPSGPNSQTQSTQGGGKRDQYGYVVFDVPWALNISYSVNYTKPGFKSNISQTLSCNGNVSITKKTAVTYTTGYDFKGKAITMTQIGITRDLHCWTMLFNWVPNGTMQSWNFTIRVKASVLGDLKYDRRKDYHDTY